ncbi:MAG: helix-turn-helix transcriptional regulator [Rhodospirillales bacterium]|nr:helix-turn-helix transcriptional regulator [Rhodospirillales bacterium]
MEDVGLLVGKTRQAISLYEAGEREPDPSTLMKLVGELKQPISFFTSDRPGSFGQRGPTFFRSFKSKTRRTNKRCEVLSDWFAQTASFFSKLVNFPQTSLPVINPPENGSGYTDEEIEEAATACRRFWGLGDGRFPMWSHYWKAVGLWLREQSLAWTP